MHRLKQQPDGSDFVVARNYNAQSQFTCLTLEPEKPYYPLSVRIFNLDISREAAKYLVVGSIGFAIDIGLFNLISIVQIAQLGESTPLSNKVLSVSLAVAFTYLGNSRWTFSLRTGRSEGFGRIARYVLVNIAGLLITLIPLYISRYVLGIDSLVADNISGSIIGTALAVAFRFLANRYWVFLKPGGDGGI